MEIARKPRNSRKNRAKMHRSTRAGSAFEPTTSFGSNHLLLKDLLDAHRCLLRSLLIVPAEAVAAGVAHDRIRGDHRATRGTRDFQLVVRFRGFFHIRFPMQSVTPAVKHQTTP